MEKFLFIFRGGDLQGHASGSEAVMANMQAWQRWLEQLVQKTILLGGEPLQPGGKQVNGKKKLVIDGPFIEGKEIVGGYLVVNANDIDEAVEISKGCPIFEEDGKVEVRQIRSL